ncbi:hypothetical protein [Flavobacterium anhuiense]|uniref:hypothetical protein n=1 Tax=Flavobacterium anhuiense TaxID=459526 RepID=UPI003D975BAE
MKSKFSHFKLSLRVHFFLIKGLLVTLGVLLNSCSEKIYQKEDYSFYNKTFKIDPSSLLRTDGIYILSSIWTNENGGVVKQTNDHCFYKFYSTGQCNLTLDPELKIKTDQDYVKAVEKDFLALQHTLFQGYYKLSDEKIIIQSRVLPRKQFEYKYGYVKKDSLIIVKAATHRKGTFDAVNYTDYYKEYYVFKSLPIDRTSEPQW